MAEVEAVKEPDKIKLISYLLKRHFGQQLADIWEVGLNLALRISDLLAGSTTGTTFGLKHINSCIRMPFFASNETDGKLHYNHQKHLAHHTRGNRFAPKIVLGIMSFRSYFLGK